MLELNCGLKLLTRLQTILRIRVNGRNLHVQTTAVIGQIAINKKKKALNKYTIMYHFTSTCSTHPINSVVHLLGRTSCCEKSLQVWPGSSEREGSDKTSKEHCQDITRLCPLLSNEVSSEPEGTTVHEEQEEEDEAENHAKTETFHGSQLSCF